tara:strand:- start:2922 stop:4478 length:1557 start_codon:yes stop_codon:yes gene_type:complete
MTEFSYSNVNDDTPVLVGCSQLTDKRGVDGFNYLDILKEVSKQAIADCEASANLSEHIDTVAVIRFVADTPHRDSATSNLWGYPNMPRSLSNSLGLSVSNEIYTTTGGNSPQIALNELANRIKDKQVDCALLAGGEALDTFVGRLKEGLPVDWEDNPGGNPEVIGKSTDGTNDHEKLHGIFDPSSVYPLFANAIRGNKGQSLEEHMQDTGELFSRFSEVASKNKNAWFPTYRSAEEIAEVKPENRMIGLPYTKYMNSIMRVNQSSAIIVMSAKKARELGIPVSKWIFMYSGACLNDVWNVSNRADYYSSPAIKSCTDSVFDLANVSISEMDFIDLYSCFPSAVQIAMEELSLDKNDPRGFTVTGGLPYFGGPGNAYVMNSIATLIEKLRMHPGKFGLATANGWYITKHGAAVFSSKPFEGEWNQVADTSNLQKSIDSASNTLFTEMPEGQCSVETYTVIHTHKGPDKGIIIGKLTDGTRFLANTERDPDVLEKMCQRDMLNASGFVSNDGKRNIFKPN